MTFTKAQWQEAIVSLANSSGADNYPQLVQTPVSAVTGSGAKTVAAQFGTGVTAGNSIVVDIGLGEVIDDSTIICTITDTLGNTYTRAALASQSTTLCSAIYYATNILGDAANSNVEGSSNATKNTVTMTLTGASAVNEGLGITIYEVTGIIELTPVAVDVTATGTNSGSTSVTTSALAPSIPNEYAFMSVAAGNGAITAGSNWTLDSGSLAPTGGNLIKFGSLSRFLSTTASVTPSATLGSSVAWCAASATFKPAIASAAGGGGSTTVASVGTTGAAVPASADYVGFGSSGNLTGVDATHGLPVNIVAGGGSGGTAAADDAAFTVGTTSATPISGLYNDSAAAATSGHADAVRLSQNRALQFQSLIRA